MHIFISYARDDGKDLALHLYKTITKKPKVTTFYDDETLLYGNLWRKMIFENIEKSDLLIAIITRDALESEMVNEEITYAQEKKIKIIPCKYQDLSWLEVKWGLKEIHGFGFKEKEELIRELHKVFADNTIKPVSSFLSNNIRSLENENFTSSRILEKAYRLTKAAKYKESNNLLKKEQKEERSLVLKSWNYQGLRDYNMALEMADEAIKLNSESVLGWLYKSNCLGIMGNIEGALNAAEKVIEYNPESADGWYNKGLCLLNLKKYEEAIKSFDQVTKLNIHSEDSWVNIGFALSKLKKYSSSAKMFEKALTIHPNISSTWSNLSGVLYSLKDYDNAIDKLVISLELDMNNSNAWYIGGLILEQIDLFQESERCFQISRELNKNYLSIRISQIENIPNEDKEYLKKKSKNLIELINIFQSK